MQQKEPHMNSNQMPSAHMSDDAGKVPRITEPNKATPGSSMSGDALGGMPSGSMRPGQKASNSEGGERVLIELKVPRGEAALVTAGSLSVPGVRIDTDFEPVPMKRQTGGDESLRAAGAAAQETVVVRATIDPSRKTELEANPNVVKVWTDGKIAPFSAPDVAEYVVEAPAGREAPTFEVIPGMATCPIGTCDCSPGTAKGNVGDVASYLGVDQIWAAGPRGDGVVVGVVDGGIRAQGRPTSEGGAQLARVIGGWPATSWGTTAAAWGDHGMMCGTDVLGMAPNAQLYDLRISDGDALSDALQAFQWAINQHMTDGTPQVLTNSWGMFQQGWAPDYTTNPNHPFTRKVLEAIDEGILVLFAAGNCGATCPDGRCGPDTGPGKSIWGANGHPRVITVGAVNKNEQFVGYSSQGPAALDPNKPDFCSITHFTGYFTSDSGTSAATPIAAGVVALLKQAKPAATQDQVKQALKSTAKDIGPAGFDQHSGAGILRAKAAYDVLAVPAVWKPWETMGGFCTDGVGVSSWGSGRLDCFVIGNDRQLWHKWFSGGWSGWDPLGGNLYSNPAAVSWGSNRIDVFAIGGDHALWHRSWDGTSWSAWESLGGFCTDGVGVSSWAPGRLDCFVVGNDRHLYHKWFDGGWSSWQDLGGNIYSDPAAVSWAPNRIDVFAIGGDHALWHRWWDGSAWGAWESLGGFCTDGAGVSSWAPGRLDCFVVGNDRQLWHKWFSGGWSGWEALGGNIYSNPTAVSWGSNRIDVFAIGGDHAMWHRWYE
jgi:subtilisin family serine protease